MRHNIQRSKVLFTLLVLSSVFLTQPIQAAELKVLSQSSRSWDGTALHYPEGEAQLSVVRITIAPGEKMPFHCHPIPSAGYVISGDLEVELKQGKRKRFHAGDPITEVVHTVHRGFNLSKTDPVELVAVYVGAKDISLTLPADAKACRR